MIKHEANFEEKNSLILKDSCGSSSRLKIQKVLRLVVVVRIDFLKFNKS